MKRILIFSYYFPPCHGSPPWRAYSWAQHFKEQGLFPVIVTRHWQGDENKWEDYIHDTDLPMKHEVTDDFEVYRLPSQKSKLFHFLHRKIFITSIFRPLYYFICDLTGNFNPEVNAFRTFSSFAKKYLMANEVDFILLTGPPFNLFKLIKKLAKVSNAKVVADFRDLWDNREAAPAYNPSLMKQFKNKLIKFHLSRLLKNVDALSTVTPAFIDLLHKLNRKDVVVIYNGFEKKYFDEITRVSNEKFTCSMIGSLYAAQNVDIMLAGIQAFVLTHQNEDILFKFIGLDPDKRFLTRISEMIDKKYLFISPRIGKALAVKETVQSDVLLYPGWKGYKGVIGVKPLDYLASRNNILLAPGDDDILDNLLTKTHSGVIANSAEEFLNELNKFYSQWKKNKICIYNGVESEIRFFSRENQAKIFAQYLQTLRGNDIKN